VVRESDKLQAETSVPRTRVNVIEMRKKELNHTVPFKSLGSLRNVLIFQRKALFFKLN